MQVYTSDNGKRKTIVSPRDLMLLRGKGAVFVHDDGKDPRDPARWSAALTYHITAGGRVIGRTS